ncbi:uncharacterized protein [Cherax quadricarinatus]|uniref:uncharacterized protein isoform X2 n=1 Tax=Cherax quadricarinatus TaxID=27406 RepID=UPI00387E3B0C
MGQVQKPLSNNEKTSTNGKRTLPFRHPDFSDDQIRQLTDIARSYKSTSSVASKRSSSRPHSGCSSPILSPTIQRLRAEGFPPLARCGSDPLLHAAPPQHAMNTGSLPADIMPSTSPVHRVHYKHRSSREHKTRDTASKDGSVGGVGGGEGGTGGLGEGGGGQTSERELVALLMTRLVAMETQLSHARQALKQRDFHIAVLEEKLRLYMKAEEEAVGSKLSFLETLKDTRMASVEEKCRKLERQVMEMERFLGEYGMVWCEAEETYLLDNPVNASGSYSSSEATSPNLTPSHMPRTHPRVRIKRHRRNHKNKEVRRVVAESTSRSISSEAEPFTLDYEKLLAAVSELNLAAQGDAVVAAAAAATAAEAGESLQLTLYKNGIVVDEGGFRNFEAVKTRQFLQDILDGFFPSELQDTFPQGIPIKVRDKRQVIFLPNSSKRKGAIRPPVPPKPRIPTTDSLPTMSSLTSVTSTLFSSVSEAETRPVEALVPVETSDSAPPTIPPPETSGDTSRLCPEMDYRSESSDVSSRRNSLQRGSDKSEGEGVGRVESSHRGSEVWRHAEVPTVPAITAVRRDSRRESESRRGSDHRTHQCRRGSECRRSSELARTTLDLDLGRRATSKHPLEWNRINRTAFLLNDDTFDSNGNRRGSVGVLSADPYDMDNLRKRRTSVEDFLAKVPTCVVKNGKIVNLREEVADMLMGPSRKNSLTLVHTPVLDEAGESQESNDQDTLVDNQVDNSDPHCPALTSTTTSTTTTHHDYAHSRTTLRIKVENGTETYLIKLKASDTLNTLRSYLRSYRGDHEEFDIVRTYPYQVLDQGESTMAELGLIPNAALHLKPASRPHPPESLSLQTSSAVVTCSATAINPAIHNVSTVISTAAGIQTWSAATSVAHAPRRVPSPALPQIPPNLHPDLPPPPVPLLCFPDSQDTNSDVES